MPARIEDHRYFAERARQAREEAALATEPHIRKLHIDFAERYERAAAALAPVEEAELSSAA